MSKQFKDFNKEVKDLLTKDTSKPGAWKAETKSKSKTDVVVNPVADSKGVAINVEYALAQYNMKTKTVLTANNVKPKVTYDCSGHKVEATLNSLKADSDFELTYESKFGDVSVFDKVTRKGADLAVSYFVGAADLNVGASVKWGFDKGFGGWSAGVRYAKAGIVADVVTNDMKKFTTGAMFPLTVAGYKLKVGGQADCVRGGACDFSAGVDSTICSRFAVKASVNNKGKVVVTAIKTFADKWKAAVTMESTECCKFGITLTRE